MVDKLRILHIGKYFPPTFGGIETFMSQLMLEQHKSGMKVSAVIHRTVTQFTEMEQDWQGIKLYCAKTYGQLAYAPISPLFLFVLSKALKQEKADVVHIHMPNLSAFWLLLLSVLKGKKSKWVIHWHSDVLGAVPDLKIKLLYPFYRVFERWLLNKSDAITCTSPNYLESSEPLLKFRDKCHVVPLGISIPENTDELGATQIRDANTLRLICIGRLTYYKGHALLFEAIKQLKSQGKNIVLDVLGKGELETQLKEIVKRDHLGDCVRFHGGVSENEKYRLLNQADMLCLPSIERTEAFGVVILEAAALGKPSLVSDVAGSGMSYVVQDQKTGVVAESNSVDSLIKQLSWASNNIAQLKVYGESANRRFKQEFSINNAENLLKDIYFDV